MLKVNVEKILADYKALQEKKAANLANIEVQVRPFAAALGYNEEKTQGLIDYVQKQNGNGLVEEDTKLLGILSSYIDEVQEPVEESVATALENDEIKQFKEQVAQIMRKDGASEQFIETNLTDNAVKEALSNKLSAESLSWSLLQ